MADNREVRVSAQQRRLDRDIRSAMAGLDSGQVRAIERILGTSVSEFFQGRKSLNKRRKMLAAAKSSDFDRGLRIVRDLR